MNDLMKIEARRKFLRACGSLLAGGSIVAVSTVLLHRTYASDDSLQKKCPDCSGCVVECPLRG